MKIKEKRKNQKGGKGGIRENVIKGNLSFALLALLGLILLFVFNYLPMGGIVLAFKKFNVTKGILGSDWIDPWYSNFRFFFNSENAWRVTRNTILLNLMFIVVGTVLCIIFAIMMFYIRKKWCVKTYQTIAIMPSFLSWVVVGYMAYAILAENGFMNNIIASLGKDPVSWYSDPEKWPMILLCFYIWHGMGYDSLFYYASLVGIDKSYFEVAALDGATVWQELRYIILPSLKQLIIILFILHIGNIFRGDFGLFWNLTRNNSLLYSTTDVVDTFIYRSLTQIQNVGMSTAVGFFQSVVGFVLILITNAIVKRIDKDSALF